ncbi:MAG: thermonuclease family protein [Mastigocoleus sp.]
MKISLKTSFYLAIVLLIFGLWGCDRLFSSSGYQVSRVSDGDTIAVLDNNNNKLNVRFACIDAPEIAHSKKEKKSRKSVDKNQYKWGDRAKKRVSELVKQSSDRVELNITDTDRYGRKVAEVRLKDGTFVQEALAREGLVVVYRNYLSKCPSKELVQEAEAFAKKRRRGVWSDKKFLKPWDYRKVSRSK